MNDEHNENYLPGNMPIDVDDSEGIQALRRLAVPSPPQGFARFRRRAAVMQGTRMLFESQVTGFWVVLDAFLRMFLGGKSASSNKANVQGEKA